jgi:hypothetical protein
MTTPPLAAILGEPEFVTGYGFRIRRGCGSPLRPMGAMCTASVTRTEDVVVESAER